MLAHSMLGEEDGLPSCELLPSAHYHVAVHGVELHEVCAPSQLFADDRCGSRTAEGVQDPLASSAAVPDKPAEQLQRLHRGMLFVPDGLVLPYDRGRHPVLEKLPAHGLELLLVHGVHIHLVLKNGVLGPVVHEVVRGTFLPSVEAGLMPPLVVLTAEDEGVLDPYEALLDG